MKVSLTQNEFDLALKCGRDINELIHLELDMMKVFYGDRVPNFNQLKQEQQEELSAISAEIKSAFIALRSLDEDVYAVVLQFLISCQRLNVRLTPNKHAELYKSSMTSVEI